MATAQPVVRAPHSPNRRHARCRLVVECSTFMASIILGQQRYALPIGETRIGGAGAGALPFPQLAAVETVAVLLVARDGVASLRSCSNGAASLTVDGVP